MIRARNLGFTFASKRVGVASIDLDVQAGELLALLGPNGSGKTTLLRLFCNDLRPGTGTLTLSAGSSAFAAAQPNHFDELSGRANALFFASTMGADAKAAAQQLAVFDLSADANVAAGAYSFGMQRKLLLAEVLAAKAELLLLDEPTIGLDPAALVTLRDALLDHVRAGNTVVMATNDVRFAALATRVVFLQRGRVIADAPPLELLGRTAARVRIDVTVAAEPATEPLFPSAATVTRNETGYLVNASDATVLPELCGALIAAGASIGAIRIHEPDLADVFQELTGEALSSDAVV